MHLKLKTEIVCKFGDVSLNLPFLYPHGTKTCLKNSSPLLGKVARNKLHNGHILEYSISSSFAVNCINHFDGSFLIES